MNLKKVIITPMADAQLSEIAAFIAANSYPEYAKRVVNQIRERINSLPLFPGAGQKRDDLLPNIRQQRVGRYLIFYQDREDAVYVLAIIHGARDLEQFFS